MCIISVIIPLCNHASHIHDAVESILNQSFVDFEIIFTDSGSTDDTLSIIRTFKDQRTRMIAGNDRIQALNAGLKSASGKYIAIMSVNHVMHVDRLKIQYAIMEAEPSIAVCGSRIKQFGNHNPAPVETLAIGLIESPLLAFLQGNCIIHATVMIRKSFLTEHQLQYENYPDVEDFKLWTEIAKHGGQFYVDTQQLLYCHVTNEQVDEQKQKELKQSSENIIHEIIECLVDMNHHTCPELRHTLENFKQLQNKGMITQQEATVFFHRLFMNHSESLIQQYHAGNTYWKLDT